MFARILALLLATSYLLLASPTFAQTATPSSTSKESKPTFEVSHATQSTVYRLPSTVSPTSPLYTDLIVSNMFHTFSCLAIGQSFIGQPCLTYKMTQNAQGAIQGVPVLSQLNTSGGTLGAVTSVIGMLYDNPPVRTADYLASVGHGLGIVKEARAQVGGSGANILNPILQLWRVSRNISYVIMIIIFVIIGFMVMFRNKLNPQTIITAQTALPGLVIGLILITFSYFLSALLVDTAFLGTNIVGAYFSAAQGNSATNLSTELKDKSALSIMGTFVGAVGQGDLNGAVSDIIKQLGPAPSAIVKTFAGFLAYQYASQFSELPVTGISAVYCSEVAALATANLAGVVSGAEQTTLVAVPNCIASATEIGRRAVGLAAAAYTVIDPATPISIALYVILIVILIYTMFKLLIRLVNSFISIIFYTITAPFQFLAASLPGRQGIVTSWILNMLCNVLAFPAVVAVFYFVNYLLGSGIAGILSSKPPFPVTGGALDITGNGALPLFGGMETSFIRLILAYGLLLATPTIPDLICRAFGKASQAGQLIGQEIKGGIQAGPQYIGRYAQGMQGVGAGITGQNQWAYDQGENRFRYEKTSPSIKQGWGGLRETQEAANARREAQRAKLSHGSKTGNTNTEDGDKIKTI